MTNTHQPRRMIVRSLSALFAGSLTVVVLSIASDVAMAGLDIFPPFGDRVADGPLLLATSYRSLYSILASYVAARLAPIRPMRHAMFLGIVGFLISTVGAITTWNAGPAFEPKWYPLALIATALPCAWAGGKLFERSSMTNYP